MPFQKFVEVGRVAYAVGGPAVGKLVTIVDVIDYNRALVDGPCTGVPRQEYRFTNLRLTKFKINIQHGQHTKHVTKAWQQGRIDRQWRNSIWAKVVEKRKTRESLTDFDRFKVGRLKYARNKLVYDSYAVIMARKKVKAGKLKLRRKIKLEKDPEKKKKLIRSKWPVKKLPGKMGDVYKRLRGKGVLKKLNEQRRLKLSKAKTKKGAVGGKDSVKTGSKTAAAKKTGDKDKKLDKTKKKTDDKTKKPGDKTKKPDDKTKKPADKSKKAGDKGKKPDEKTKKPADKGKKPAAKGKSPKTDK